jgi:hypothetical protein
MVCAAKSSNAPVTPISPEVKPKGRKGKLKGRDYDDAAAHALETVIGRPRGYWWRSNRYEIRDSRIVPVGRVQMYDPGTLDPRPHESLYSLAQELRLLEVPPPKFSEIAPGPILKWVSRYGLLGILPARLLQLTTAERWRRFRTLNHEPADWGTATTGPRAAPLYPAHTRYTRTPTGWWEQIRFRPMPAPNGVREGDALAGSLRPPPPEGIMLDWQTQSYRTGTPAALGLHRYFDIAARDTIAANAFDYPMPFSDAFWHDYGEPLPEFLNTVMLLAQSISSLGKLTAHGFESLNWLLTGAQPFVQPSRVADATTRDGLIMPSLIHTIGEAIRRDAIAANAPRQCPNPNCLKLFHSRDPRKVYCGARCQAQFKMREYRLRQRAAKGK